MSIQSTAYNFLVHPLSEEHSTPVKVTSVIVNIALIILTKGWYLTLLSTALFYEYSMSPQRDVAPISAAAGRVEPEEPPGPSLWDRVSGSVVSMTRAQPGQEESSLRDIKSNHARLPRHEFLGTEALKEIHGAQLEVFEKWARIDNWELFHPDNMSNPFCHYDWWIFPITNTSRGQGHKYTVSRENIESLKADRAFMQNYRRGVELVLLSLGWSVQTRASAEPHTDAQRYRGYQIRLQKMERSLREFGQADYLSSLREFARQGNFRIS